MACKKEIITIKRTGFQLSLFEMRELNEKALNRLNEFDREELLYYADEFVEKSLLNQKQTLEAFAAIGRYMKG